MHLSFKIEFRDQSAFFTHWASKYEYPAEAKYTRNIGKPLTRNSRKELFEWKNGTPISAKKTASIEGNYPLSFFGDQRARYLSHKESGGAIWNIFYLHCLEPEVWPIFDQHTFRAMRFLKTGRIVEIGATNKQKYSLYENEYIPFLKTLHETNHRKVDRALFAFGQFLKRAAGYA